MIDATDKLAKRPSSGLVGRPALSGSIGDAQITAIRRYHEAICNPDPDGVTQLEDVVAGKMIMYPNAVASDVRAFMHSCFSWIPAVLDELEELRAYKKEREAK